MNAGQEQAAAGRPPNGQRGSYIPSFLFISFALFMLTNHNGDEYLARHKYRDAITSLTQQSANFTAWLNGTDSNFTLPERDTALVSLIDSLGVYTSDLDSREQGGTYYTNITGFFHGDLTFHNISSPADDDDVTRSSPSWRPFAQRLMAGTNMTELVRELGTWNWSASDKLAMSLMEKPHGVVGVQEKMALVHGRIELTDAHTKEDFRLEFEGVHFVADGSLYGFAEPTGRHIDIRLLPSLVPEEYRNDTARIIVPELTARIAKLRDLIDAGVIDQEITNDDPPNSACPFTVHAKLAPAGISPEAMTEIEEEIERPTGVWTVKPPKLAMTGVLVSKECGILYEIKDTFGVRSSTFFRKVTTYAGLATLSNFALLLLLTRQIDRSRTPAGFSRVSRWSFLTQAIVDSVSFAGHITFAILTEGRSSLSLVPPAFLACVLFIYEAQFALTIHQVQLPEDAVPVVQPAPPTPPQADSTDAAGGTRQPPTQATATPDPQNPTFFNAFMQHLRSDPQARLWLTLFVCLSLVIRIILSPPVTLFFVGCMYSFFWVPQIWRSARRGRGSGLSGEYLVGTTVARLFFVLYFLACPRNVLDVDPRSWIYVVAVAMFGQVVVILLQDHLSPAFFLPSRYATAQTYDYHPVMQLSDQEAPEKSLGDCAICMDAIHVERAEDAKAGVGIGAGRLFDRVSGGVSAGAKTRGRGRARGNKSYSLAPCHHLFHTDCLEKWLAIKNICPQCRRPLPPL